MKTTSKILLALMVVATLAAGACSRTKDALGTDTIENLVTVGSWPSVLWGGQGGTELIVEGGRAEFSKKDHLIHYYDDKGNQTKTEPFSFDNGTKRMTWNGTVYEIQENFVSTAKSLTLIEPSTKKVMIAFYRDRQTTTK